MNENSEIDFLKNEFFIQWALDPSEEHDIYWNRWMAQNPGKVDAAKRARALILSLKPASPYNLEEDRYNEMFDRILMYKRELDDKKYLMERKNRPGFGLYAAAVVVVLFLSAMAYVYLNSSQPLEIRRQKIVKETPNGVKQTFALEDGSLVKLNAGSALTYSSPFNDSTRVVYLTGEAYFEVTPDSARPFIIKTDNFETIVLGTSFNIRAYPEGSQFVAVASGSVSVVGRSGPKKVLQPYEMGEWQTETETFTTKAFDFRKILGWKDGLLLFEKADFEEIEDQLTRWFGVNFIIEEGLEIPGKYSGEFRNESLENILDGIGFSSDFQYRIEDNKVFIFK